MDCPREEVPCLVKITAFATVDELQYAVIIPFTNYPSSIINSSWQFSLFKTDFQSFFNRALFHLHT